jgi:hypothetical protein
MALSPRSSRMDFYAAPETKVREPLSRGVKAFGYLLIASSFMSYVPGANVGTGIFVAVLVCVLLYQILLVRPTLADGRTVAMVIFVLYALGSVFNLMANGWGVEEWSRGVLPFTFFALAIFLPALTLRDHRWLANALFVTGLCWLARILLTAVVLSFQGSNVLSERLTFDVVDAVMPYPLMMAPYLLFGNVPLRSWFKWGLLLILLYVYIWIGYRAGLLLMLVPILIYFLEQFRRFNVISITVVLAGLFLLYHYNAFSEFDLMDRYQQLGDDVGGSRSMEWDYALNSFEESPIIGKGVGWQVPGSVTFFGLDQNEGAEVAHVGYVHSSLGYMAMTLGVIGIALYFFIVIPRFRFKQLRREDLFPFLSLLLILIFCLTQASYRTIQTVLMLVALIRLNVPSSALPYPTDDQKR